MDPQRRHRLCLTVVSVGVTAAAALSLLYPQANAAITLVAFATNLLWIWS